MASWFQKKRPSKDADLFEGRWVATDGKVMTVTGDKIMGTTKPFAMFTAKNADGCMIKTTDGKPFAASFGADRTLIWTDGDVWRREDRPPASALDALDGASAPPPGNAAADADPDLAAAIAASLASTPPDAAAAQALAGASAPPDAAAAQALAGGAPDLPRAGWLAAEALRLEAQAKENDRAGSVDQALLGYRRALAKLTDAAECCQADHFDREAMAEHGQDLTMRMVYLESLGGRAATEPVENHLPEDEGLAGKLTLDLTAEAPSDHNVASLLGATGVTGTTAPLSDEGLSLVTALGSGDEMRAFVNRTLSNLGLEIHDGSEPMGEFYGLTEGAAAGDGPRGLKQLEAELRGADWVRNPAAEAQAAADAAEAERLRLEAEAAKAATEAKAAQDLAAEQQEAARVAAEQQEAARVAAEAAAAARKELEKDKLNLAIVLEKEGKELEARGKQPEALLKYITCSHAFKYVYDYDTRCKNSDKVKEMVRQRLENVVAECTRMQLDGVVASAQ